MELTENIKDKIWRIADGIPLELSGKTIRIADGKLLITGWMPTIHFENIDKHKVLNDLIDLKAGFQELSNIYPELNIIKDRNNLELEYHIAHDDQGKVGIGLCSEINGVIHWYI